LAPDLARRDLVWLGTSCHAYQPQQSLRTFLDVDDPARHYVKTALSVRNMGFVRGLSAAFMAGAPAINGWVHDLVVADPELQDRGLTVLREVAATGYVPSAYAAAGPSPATKLLAGLWRESPVPRARPGERLATMASLLHVDRDGTAYVARLVAA